MMSGGFVDPELFETLQQLPWIDANSDTLQDLRTAMAELRLPAPEAPGVTAEDVFIPTGDKRTVRVVVYRPAVARYSGALLWIHGGGMIMGVPEMDEAQNRHIAHESNCIVVAVQYRLAPEDPFPAGFDDCYAALTWMHENAAVLGVPVDRIAIAGESGGGALAVGVSLFARDRAACPIGALFLLSPMLDDRTGTAADPEPMPFAGHDVWTRNSNAFAWAAVLGTTYEDPSPCASPGRAATVAGLPATFISIGDIDLFIAENLRFAQRLIKNGVPTELHVYQGAAHGFTSLGATTRIAVRGRDEFFGAIRRHFLR